MSRGARGEKERCGGGGEQRVQRADEPVITALAPGGGRWGGEGKITAFEIGSAFET